MSEQYRVSECKRCKAEIVWARTGRGKKLPLDAKPSSAGVFILEGGAHNPVTYRLSNDAAATYTGEKYQAHWATCPAADDFRNKRDRNAG